MTNRSWGSNTSRFLAPLDGSQSNTEALSTLSAKLPQEDQPQCSKAPPCSTSSLYFLKDGRICYSFFVFPTPHFAFLGITSQNKLCPLNTSISSRKFCSVASSNIQITLSTKADYINSWVQYKMKMQSPFVQKVGKKVPLRVLKCNTCFFICCQLFLDLSRCFLSAI